MTTASFREFTGTGAETYQRHFVPNIANPVAEGLLEAAALRPGESVLDVACGTGAVTRLAAAAVGPTGSVTGVDIAPDMIEVARSTPTPLGPGIEWHVGDATSLPFPTGTYDVVLCQMGLMFIEDKASAVAEIARVTKPGGRVVVNTPGPIQPPFEGMEQGLVEHIGPGVGKFVRAVFSMHDPEVLATLFTRAGLAEVTATVSTVPLRLPAPAEFLWQYINLTPMGPIVRKAPEEAQLALERHVVEQLQPFVSDGATVVDQPMVLAQGRRR